MGAYRIDINFRLFIRFVGKTLVATPSTNKGETMMKKYFGTLLAGIALFTSAPMLVHADNTSQNTTAEIELSQDEANKDITLDTVPTIDMGAHTNDTASQTYTADSIDSQVHVTNPGNTEGWNVQVSGTNFEDSDSNKTLRGAKLTLVSGTVKADDLANASDLPTTNTVTVNSEAAPILSAAEGEGIGLFSLSHDTSQVSCMYQLGMLLEITCQR